jgi:hypothetical protein
MQTQMLEIITGIHQHMQGFRRQLTRQAKHQFGATHAAR